MTPPALDKDVPSQPAPCLPSMEVIGLSKRYRRGIYGAHTLRDELRMALAPQEERDLASGYFHALREVSLETYPGTIYGLVGANGSGKSTLMKLMARITAPSDGEIRLYGRLCSLLEVGAAFDPQLSGHDNIFLFGAIMGMKRAEIRRKMDSIVAFADIGPVLGTQVKRYSSGMYMRLAFSVVVHLDADILLLDEIFAVGDHEFRLKCYATLRELAQAGRTIILVSHDMELVQSICDEAFFFEGGILAARGTPSEMADLYLARLEQKFERDRLMAEIYRADQ